MKQYRIEYPHPILMKDKDDYINCQFELLLDIEDFKTGVETISFIASYELDCDGLKELILKGKAKAVIILQSSTASYRNVFDFPINITSAEFTFPKDRAVKNLEVTCCIIACSGIKPFALKEFNQIYYKSSSLAVRKGDFLALTDTKIFDLDASELEKPLSSIFNISKHDGLDMMISPSFDGEKIEIQLLPDVFDIYYKLRLFNNGSFRRYLSGIVVLPVLTEAIDRMIGNILCEPDVADNRMFELRWYKAIDKKLLDLNIDLKEYRDSSVSLASKLLGDIVFDALASFKATMDDEMGGNEIQRIGSED